ncbi:hypothetical protein AVEN_7309-1 [Araneus ventricosus]|uniref:Uncharacterized protein n=1 Tax=Araneus ventricosus TaxID=182803 RepID=A0A4Y2SDH3_ARAVE|nr:hypothetical protein AVEN_7309-1 [Araneus ventricosus]
MVLTRTGQPYDVVATLVGQLVWIVDSMLPTVVLQEKSVRSSLFPFPLAHYLVNFVSLRNSKAFDMPVGKTKEDPLPLKSPTPDKPPMDRRNGRRLNYFNQAPDSIKRQTRIWNCWLATHTDMCAANCNCTSS